MTNEAAAPAPTHQSPAAFWFGQCSQKGKEDVLKDIGVELAQRYRVYRETLREALGLKNLPPAGRLAAYQGRPPTVWRLLAQVWPQTYEQQTKDWSKLENTAIAKGLVHQIVRQIPASAGTGRTPSAAA